MTSCLEEIFLQMNTGRFFQNRLLAGSRFSVYGPVSCDLAYLWRMNVSPEEVTNDHAIFIDVRLDF